MYSTVYESLTLHNIVDQVHAFQFVGNKQGELYWLGKLEEFLYTVR